MTEPSVDPSLLYEWLCARSIARGVPQPIAEHGGFRVDTGSDVEISRWVFPRCSPGLMALARSIDDPRYLLKLCGEADALRAAVPDSWEIQDAPNYLMRAGHDPFEGQLPNGYVMNVERTGDAIAVRIWTDAGVLAASGYGGETPTAFVYDRIVTAADYRRKGLGRVVMAALQAARRNRDGHELLVATEDGQALYRALGWRTISPYSTAFLTASPPQ